VAFQIVWHPAAKAHFNSIQQYLLDTWGEAAVEKFSKRVFSFLEILEKFPHIGSVENAELNIRGFTLSKQTRLLYKLVDNHIYLIAFYDLRMNPDSKSAYL
jgi:plasmid stabilization system protein ParE